MARRLPILALLAAIVALVVILARSDGQPHQLRAVFAAALQVVPGEKVEIAGRQVGSIASAHLSDGAAVVVMNVDDSAWPLHAGTVARLRYGSPLGYALRYVELDPGPATAPTLANGGILGEAHTVTPVEFDDVTRTYNPATRRYLKELWDNADATLHGEGPQLASTLAVGGPATERIAGFESDLAQDPTALDVLLKSAAATATALQRHNPQLQALVSDAADTLHVLASQARAVQTSLELAPSALNTGRHTLAHLDPVIGTLHGLVNQVRPGAIALRATAPELSAATTTLSAIAPRLQATLDAATELAPVITTFLGNSTNALPSLTEALRTLAPMLGCLRPYTPEVAGALVESDSVNASYDSYSHFTRDLLVSSPIPLGTSSTPQQLISQYPNLRYAMPRPPGLNAGQPWFQPQCGAGRRAMNPAHDREGKP